MLFKKFPCFFVILLTCHDIQRNTLSGCLSEIFYELLKNIEVFVHADIKHSFCPVKAQPGPLPSGKQDSPDFSLLYNFHAFCPKLFPARRDFRKLHRF